jgi:hypothetical protein
MHCLAPEMRAVEAAEYALMAGNPELVDVVEMLIAWMAFETCNLPEWAQRADDVANIAVFRAISET